MFLEIVEYENIIEKIQSLHLTELQTDVFLNIISENLTLLPIELIEIAKSLSKNETILLDCGTYSLDPILNESKTINLIEIVIPLISKYIPKEILGFLTEKHVGKILEQIVDVEFDDKTTRKQLEQRIDEMFSSGDISIPVQGLRPKPVSPEIVLNGIIAQRLHKGIQFGKEFHSKPTKSLRKNKNILRYALKDFNMVTTEDETPLTKILPKFFMVLKNLSGSVK